MGHPPTSAFRLKQTRNAKCLTLNMIVGGFLRILLALLSISSSDVADSAPQLVYGTYLGGRDKDGVAAIAVDSIGNAYVVGRTPSPDFPVTAGAFSSTTRV